MGTSIRQQQDEREYMEYKDKFGRLYHTQIERKTGDPCQALRPIDWTAPRAPSWFAGYLLPPEDLDIMTMIPKAARTRLGYQIDIRFDRWLEKWDEAMEGWEKKLQDFARGLTKQMNPIELINNPTPELLKIVGPKPFPPREFIMAAAAGNDWANGLSDKVPGKAQVILDILAPRFLTATGEKKKGGGSVIYDPFAGDDDREADDDLPESIRRRPAIADPLDDDGPGGSLASFAVGQQLEEQFNPEALGGKVVAPSVAEGKGKQQPKKTTRKPAAESAAPTG